MSVSDQDDMQDRRRSYIDPRTGEFLFLEWDTQRDGWAPAMTTMTSWRHGQTRVYQPSDQPTMFVTMPGHIRWPLLTQYEEDDIRVLLAHPWIPDGQATEGITEDQINDIDLLQTLMSEPDYHHHHHHHHHHHLLDTILRPTLFMDSPLTLVQQPDNTVYAAVLLASLSQPQSQSQPQPQPQPQSHQRPPPFPKHLADQVLLKAETDGQTCPITMEPIKRSGSIVTSCGHVFQKTAITEWMQSHDTCPECRQTCSV